MSFRLIRTSLSRGFPNKYRFLQAALTSCKVSNPSEFSRPAVSLLLPLSARGGCWLATVSVTSSHYEDGASYNIGTTLGTMWVALLLASLSERNDYQQCEASRDVEAAQTQNQIVDNAISKALSRLFPLLMSCKYTPHELKDRKIHGGVQLHALIYRSELETAHRMVRASQCCVVMF